MERRYYKRLLLNISCILINNYIEHEGHLCDISESGVGIIINDNNNFIIGDLFTIQFVDSYKNYTFVISEIVKIVNILKNDDNSIRLGCIFYKQISQECLDYIHILNADLYLK